MTVDPLHVHGTGRQRHAGADRAAAVPLQQLFDLRRDNVVAAGSVVEDPELVLHLFRTVDGNGDADLVLGQEFDDLRLQQRRVRREAEVHLLADLRGALPRIRNGLLQHWKIQQRFPAEERDVGHPIAARFLQHEVDALARRLLAHELGLLAVFGVDNLVFAVLVAVLAAQIALVRDVQHHRGQRERRQRDDFRLRRLRRAQLTDRPHAHELFQRRADSIAQDGCQFLARVRLRADRSQHRVGSIVESPALLVEVGPQILDIGRDLVLWSRLGHSANLPP